MPSAKRPRLAACAASAWSPSSCVLSRAQRAARVKTGLRKVWSACTPIVSAYGRVSASAEWGVHRSGDRKSHAGMLRCTHTARGFLPVLQEQLPIPDVDPALLLESDFLEMRDLFKTKALMQCLSLI